MYEFSFNICFDVIVTINITGYMSEDEVIEVTPQSVRLRKLELDAGIRERAARARKKQLESLKNKK